MNIQHSKFPVQYSIFSAIMLAVLAIGFCAFAHSGELSIKDNGETLTVLDGENVVLKYNIATLPSPDPEKPFYQRSGHIHPLCTPNGHVVTGDMCSDHLHQHAIWFAWTSSQYDGRKVDFWNSAAQQGRIEHAEVLDKEPDEGPRDGEGDFKIRMPRANKNEARFSIRLNHIDLTGKEPKTVINEVWDVTVKAQDDVYIVDLTSTQTCTTDKPLVIKKYHYGAMGLRSPMAWNAPHGGFLTSDGKKRENGNHTRPDWVDSFGPVENEDGKDTVAGVTVMQHPSNFRYPQPVRLHPKFSYFCFAPMVLGDFAIEPGEEYVSRFRYVVHDGPLDKKQTLALWREFSRGEIVFKIGIAKDGKLTLNGAPVNKEGLKRQVWKRLGGAIKDGNASSDVTAEIAADEEAPFQHVSEVMSIFVGVDQLPSEFGKVKIKVRSSKED